MACFLWILFVLNAITSVVVYQNRTSEKMVGAYAPVSIGALVTVVLVLFTFAAQPGIKEKFPVCIFIDYQSTLPLQLEKRLTTTFFSSDLKNRIAAQPVQPNDTLRSGQYHQVLQRAIVDKLSMIYCNTWNIDSARYDMPFADEQIVSPVDSALVGSSLKLSVEDVFSQYPPENLSRLPALSFYFPTISLPPGSTFNATPPDVSKLTDQVGTLMIKNRFSSITVHTIRRGGFGSLGEYEVMAGGDGQLHGQGALKYELTFEASFTWWLSGHPDMPKYVGWARTMLSELRESFDEQTILRKSRGSHTNPKTRPVTIDPAPRKEIEKVPVKDK